jgi:DNA-binding Lrp family transcriptional regulator
LLAEIVKAKSMPGKNRGSHRRNGMNHFEATDRRLVNQIQTDFPLEIRPFEVLGRRLGIAEEEVIERLRVLKEKRIVRQISAIFDSSRLGYRSTLVAMMFPPERLDEAAALISKHPGVTHNYARNHDFNLWFTLTVKPEEDLSAEVAALARETGALDTLLLPTVRLFKIGVNFDVLGEAAPGDPEGPSDRGPRGLRAESTPTEDPRAAGLADLGTDAAEEVEAPPEEPRGHLSEEDKGLVRELQRDLPLAPRPFELAARALGMTEEGLLGRARDYLRLGVMRRFAAVLHHRQAGFVANAMGVWVVPEGAVQTVGKIMAGFAGVSHCYQRPSYPPAWPYNLFTMVHGRSLDECQSILREISEATGITNYTCLYSAKEYKKTRVRYFEG